MTCSARLRRVCISKRKTLYSRLAAPDGPCSKMSEVRAPFASG
jgi:hypothetical protein